jgi:alkaline phosphatase
MVADGMSVGTFTLADHYSWLTRGRGLRWVEVSRRPGASTALMNMRSLNSLVTDSSAASSSWGSGSRIVNGTVNVLPDGRALHPLYELFGNQGWKRGLVTTTEITHATPAGFAATGLKRDAADTIAAQYLDRRVEVLLGGGSTFFDPAKRKDKRDLFADFRAQGYRLLRQAKDLDAAPLDAAWLGTFAGGHLPYSIDHIADPKAHRNVPSLASMTRAALRKLGGQEHFILQVEGGRVDHACHGCDAAAAVHDLVAFDEALDRCMEFVRDHPETLLVITTDHGNGNPGLNGTGDAYGRSSPMFANLRHIRLSLGDLAGRFKGVTSAKRLGELIYDATGYRAPEAKLKLMLAFHEKKGQTIYDQMNSVSSQLGQLIANYVGVGWTSGSHTADYVPLTALGPGSERFRGFLQNTDVFGHYLDLAGIDFRNPSVPLLAECGPSAEAAESSAWV